MSHAGLAEAKLNDARAWRDRWVDVACFLSYCGFLVAAFGAPAALFWDASWSLAIGGVALWLGTILAWEISILGLRIEIVRNRRLGDKLQARNQQKQIELLQMQSLLAQTKAEGAALRAEASAKQAELVALRRLESQMRAELYARELLAEQQRVRMAYQRIELNQLELQAEASERRAAQIQIRLEQAQLWKVLAQGEETNQDKILAAYETGYEHGKAGVMFGRHLRLVEDSA